MSSFLQDLQFGFRTLRRRPGASATIVVTLALGVSAAASIFSFVSGVLLRPLDLPNPDRIVSVCETHPEIPDFVCNASPANWDDWTRASRTMAALGIGRGEHLGVRLGGSIRGMSGGIATPGLFEVFAAVPAAGRLFMRPDLLEGGDGVTVIAHSFWQTHLGGAPDVVGTMLEINGRAHEIVGILPEGFAVPWLRDIEVWVPLRPEQLDRRDWRGFRSFGRMREGVTLAQARTEFSGLRNHLAAEHPETNAAWGISIHTVHDRIVGAVRPALLAFFGAGLLVLLIATANVANLLLARGAARESEFATRLALGAGGGRLARQLIAENLPVSLLGGALGALLASWTVHFLLAISPRWFPRLQEVRIDLPVLAFAVAIAVTANLLFSLAPMWQITRLNLADSLRLGRGGNVRRSTGRLLQALVVVQIALACILLAGAGLLLRSFGNLLAWEPGFDPDNLVFVQVIARSGDQPRSKPLAQLFAHTAEELASLPGVAAVGSGSGTTFLGGDGTMEFFIQGRPIPAPGEHPSVAWFDVDPSYFTALGVPLIRGRFFTSADGPADPAVAIVNQAMVRRHWPDGDPIGERIHMPFFDKAFEIVGVVGDIQPLHTDRDPQPEIYWPFAQMPRGAVRFILRTHGDPVAHTAAIRARVERVDPNLDIIHLRTMKELVAAERANPRFSLAVAGWLALLAAVLAAVGVYGLMSFSVSRRTHEIGVRIALGADQGSILRLILRRGVTLVLLGLLIGLAGALAAGPFLRSLLVGVQPADPMTLAAIALLLALATLPACWLPARRAARTEAMEALRHE